METGSPLYESRKRLRRPFLIAENFQIVCLGRSGRPRGGSRNNPLKNRTHCAHLFLQRRSEIFTRPKTEAECEASQGFRLSRNDMRLLFGLYLQTMLDAAEKSVSIIAGQHFLARKKIQLTKSSQRFEHTRFLQEWMTRSVDKLQSLHDEFDLANASAAKFHVAFQIFCADYVALDAPLDTSDFVPQVGRRAFRVNERLMLP